MTLDNEYPHLFEHTFTNAPIGIALVAPDGSWIRVNKALCKLLEYSADELYNSTFQQLTHPDDLDADITQMKSVLAGKASGYTIEKRYITKSDKIIPAKLSVSLVKGEGSDSDFFVSHIESLQLQKELEAKLRKDATQLSSIIDAIPDPLIVKNEHLEAVVVNKAYSSLLKLTNKQMIGKTPDQYLRKELVNDVIEADRQVLKGNKSVEHEQQYKDANGQNPCWIVTKKCIYKSDAGDKYIVEILRDVTDHKLQQQNMKLKHDELESINKVMMGRELRMAELKAEISKLKKSKS